MNLKTQLFLEKIEDLKVRYSNINYLNICNMSIQEAQNLNNIIALEKENNLIEKKLKENIVFSRLLDGNNFDKCIKERSKVEIKTQSIYNMKKQIDTYFTNDIYKIEYKNILKRYKDEYEAFTKNMKTNNNNTTILTLAQTMDLIPNEWLLTENILSVIEDLNYRKQKTEEFYNKSSILKSLYEHILQNNNYIISNVTHLNNSKIISEEDHITDIINANTVFIKIYKDNSIEKCKSERLIAEEKIIQIKKIKNDILEIFENEIFSIDYSSMLNRFKMEYNSIFKFFNRKYRADRRQMKALYKHVAEKLDDITIISVLSKLKDIHNIKTDINEQCSNFIAAFSHLFAYENTDFNTIDLTLITYNELIRSIQTLSEMKDISCEFDVNEYILKNRYGNLYKGLKTSWDDIDKTIQWFIDFRVLINKDSTILQPYYKNIGENLSEHLVIDTLILLQNIDMEKQNIDNTYTCFITVMDNIFEYEKTNYQIVDAILSTYRELQTCKTTIFNLIGIIEQFSMQEKALSEQYEFLYNGITTSWQKIQDAINWTISFKKLIDKYQLNQEFVKCICTNPTSIKACNKYEVQILSILQNLNVDFSWFLNFFNNKDKMKNMNLSVLSKRVQCCADGLSLLEEWIDFVNVKRECEKEGLIEYINQIEAKKIAPYKIIPIFQKRFFRLWLDTVLPNYPSVMNFRRQNQENIINEFAELDRMQLEISKARIRSKLINNLPSFDNFVTGLDEVGILKRELSKQRRIMPIRKLFRQIPNLLLTLKPCLMMSPLSVSLFLEADTYKFDTVIFDEASQVMTENAIGAIFRGKQVIIAGDSKQLPPTNFFSTSNLDSDYDKDDDENYDDYAYESILDEANLLPEKTLLWHYRSRHEHLIAFSNAKIYHNNLITFPSNVDKAADIGVEYFYVKDGVYDRGGKKGNVIEAQKVAELVFEHFRKYPHHSLGVIAFGEVQQQAIEASIRKMRIKNQGFEPFFNEDKEEPFFVKNLENVQGDERDTIIFSIGYAKDVNGVFRMNFGPLSKSGGERRLNVAITRAKYNVKLVGSIMPTEINTDKISAEGPKLLRLYIDFAINGIDVLNQEITESDITEYDSPFEKAVYDFLDRKGYKLATQVGCSGYRIDIAVKHPTISGQYILGIECDGATYHSARTARERDRLRQDILENMGWKIYRIWSTDWIKDPITEGNRLIETIEYALKNYGISNEDLKQDTISTPDDFVSIEEKEVSIEDSSNPYGFEKEKTISFSDLPRDDYGYLSIEDCIVEVINKCFPIHYDLLCKELAPLFGNKKATIKIKRAVDYGLNNLGTKIVKKDNFLYPRNYDKIIPRQNNTRKIEYVSKEELAEVMMCVLDKCIGVTRETLCVETAKTYNYNRMTENISLAMNNAFDLLLNDKRISILDEKVLIL